MKTTILACTLLSLALTGCAANSRAEAEISKAKAEVAKAEAEAAKAKAEAEAAKAKSEADAAADRARAEAAKPEVEAKRRNLIGADALARVQRNGPEIASGAFPYAIGAVPYKYATLEGVAHLYDGYQATVKLYYSNIVGSNFHMEILVCYDMTGGYRSSRIGYCNDRYATPRTGGIFDKWLK